MSFLKGHGSALVGLAIAAGLSAFLSIQATAGEPPVHRVGAVTRHAGRFVGRHVRLSGYLLARKLGYILFSDEPQGRVSRYDLPVTGRGIEKMQRMKKYLIEGEFLDRGLTASNGNRYHLEMSARHKDASVIEGGKEVVDLNREVFVLRKIEGEWKIVLYIFNTNPVQGEG